MEKYVDMKSPLTGGRVKEVCTTEVKEFRKERFLVHVRYYVCEDTGEQFTTTRQDTLQFNDLYAQYRIRHHGCSVSGSISMPNMNRGRCRRNQTVK